jgi:RNA polymerase sigma-70 factor, ECF subfamily
VAARVEANMTIVQEELTDEEIVRRIRTGDSFLFEIIMRRYNQRLFRVTKSILKNDGEAEDVIQDAYVRAYENLHQFAGEAKFATWLTKIAIYESLRRLRQSKRLTSMEKFADGKDFMSFLKDENGNPEKDFFRRRIIELLEKALGNLPAKYSLVIMLRDVEGLNTEETAKCLGISEEAVKTRLHRARSVLRQELSSRAGVTVKDLYPFAGERCDRIVAAVMKRITA